MLFKKESFILEIDIAYLFFMEYDAHIVLLRERQWAANNRAIDRLGIASVLNRLKRIIGHQQQDPPLTRACA